MDARDQPKKNERNRETSIYSASLSVQFRQLIQLLKFIVPILVASGIYNYLNHNGGVADSDGTAKVVLPDIPVSKVLKHNLQVVDRSRPWEYAVLTHALLEFQNPEFTVFAGPGVGVNLKKLPGIKSIEAFPNGKLPRAQRTSSGKVGGGRYDWWGRVKGLRTAKSVIDTTIEMVEDNGRKSDMGTLMPVQKNGSVSDAAGLGWTSLLLGWADVDDSSNPVVGLDKHGKKRNAYIEAADRQVRCLLDDTGVCNLQYRITLLSNSDEHMTGSIPTPSTAQPTLHHMAISHVRCSPQLWSDGIFMFGPFLAGYAVLKQDVSWIDKIIEQAELYAHQLSTSITIPSTSSFPNQPQHSQKQHDLQDTTESKQTCDGLWKHIAHEKQTPNSSDDICCQDPHVWLTGTGWALAGLPRILATVNKWRPPESSLNQIKGLAEYHDNNFTQFTSTSRARLLTLITPMVDCLIQSYTYNLDTDSNLLRNYLDRPDRTGSTITGDAAGTALIASSLYRLAVLEPGLFANDPSSSQQQQQQQRYLAKADAMYAAVANCISGSTGIVSRVADVDTVPSKFVHLEGTGTSEAQSFVLMMWAARRDCVAVGICRDAVSLGRKRSKLFGLL